MDVPNLCHKQIVLCRFPLFQFKIIRGFREIENFRNSLLRFGLIASSVKSRSGVKQKRHVRLIRSVQFSLTDERATQRFISGALLFTPPPLINSDTVAAQNCMQKGAAASVQQIRQTPPNLSVPLPVRLIKHAGRSGTPGSCSKANKSDACCPPSAKNTSRRTRGVNNFEGQHVRQPPDMQFWKRDSNRQRTAMGAMKRNKCPMDPLNKARQSQFWIKPRRRLKAFGGYQGFDYNEVRHLGRKKEGKEGKGMMETALNVRLEDLKGSPVYGYRFSWEAASEKRRRSINIPKPIIAWEYTLLQLMFNC